MRNFKFVIVSTNLTVESRQKCMYVSYRIFVSDKRLFPSLSPYGAAKMLRTNLQLGLWNFESVERQSKWKKQPIFIIKIHMR